MRKHISRSMRVVVRLSKRITLIEFYVNVYVEVVVTIDVYANIDM